MKYTTVRGLAPNFDPKQGRRGNPYASTKEKPTFIAETDDGTAWSYRGYEILIDDITPKKKGSAPAWSAVVRRGSYSVEEANARSEAGALKAGKLVVDRTIYADSLSGDDLVAHEELMTILDRAYNHFRGKKLAHPSRAELAREVEILTRPTGAYRKGRERWMALSIQDRIDLLDEALEYELGFRGEANPRRRKNPGIRKDENPSLSPSQVAKLPVGSLVFEAVNGRPQGQALVVIQNELVTPISVLPERADGEWPGGDPPDAFGSEFLLIREGRGQLPTNATAQRAAQKWWDGRRANPKSSPRSASLKVSDRHRNMARRIANGGSR
jgi:hypothetical protein